MIGAGVFLVGVVVGIYTALVAIAAWLFRNDPE